MSLSLDELSSFIQVVSKNKVKQIEVVGERCCDSSNIQKFYDLIAAGEIQKDQQAKDFFFNSGPYQDVYYNRLKRKLSSRLINTLFFIDVNQPDFSDIQKAYYTCYKETAAIKILLGRHVRKPAISIAEKLIKKAIKFTFTDIIIEIARILRLHYANIEGNKKKFKKYNDLFKYHLKVYQAETIAEEYYSTMVMNFASSCSTKPEIVAETETNVKELQSLQKQYSSYRFDLYTYLLSTNYFELQNDFKRTVIACKEAIDCFEAKPHLLSIAAVTTFLMKKLSCYIILKNFDEGEKTAKKCLSLQEEGTINWVITLDYYIRLLFHFREWDKAFEVYQLVSQKGNISNQYKGISEHWKIHEAFIYYLNSLNKIRNNEQKKIVSFRLSKFLNEVPNYSKDKRGINIAIIIVQILFLLHQKKYGVIIDKTEALKTYSHRYLRRDDTFRSNCFIKMLLCLPAASFHKVGVIRKAKKFKELLHSVPLQEANQTVEIEFIPYEILWEFVLESLDTKFH